MEQSIWTDFVAKQAPIVIVLAIFCYGMYKFFTGQLKARDAIIREKDKNITDQNAKVMDLYGRAIEAQNRSTLISEQLLDSVNKLNDKIK